MIFVWFGLLDSGSVFVCITCLMHYLAFFVLNERNERNVCPFRFYP